MDILSGLPIAPIMLFACVSGDVGGMQWIYRTYLYCRVLFLLRIRKLSGVWSNILSCTEQWNRYFGSKQKLFDGNVLRVGIFVVGIWGFVHVVACLFVYIGFAELEWYYSTHTYNADSTDVGGDGASMEYPKYVSWIWSNDVDLLWYSAGQVYLRAYYWGAYTVITVGYGSISLVTNMERIFAMAAMTVGAIVCNAGIAAVLGHIIGNVDRMAGTCRRNLESALQFLKSRKMSRSSQKVAVAYNHYLARELGNVIHESEDFFLLSDSIRTQFIYHCVHRELEKILFLRPQVNDMNRDCAAKAGDPLSQRGFIFALCRRMQMVMTLPGEVVVDGRSKALTVTAVNASKQTSNFSSGHTQNNALDNKAINTSAGNEPDFCNRGNAHTSSSSTGTLLLTERGWEGDLWVLRRGSCSMRIWEIPKSHPDPQSHTSHISNGTSKGPSNGSLNAANLSVITETEPMLTYELSPGQSLLPDTSAFFATANTGGNGGSVTIDHSCKSNANTSAAGFAGTPWVDWCRSSASSGCRNDGTSESTTSSHTDEDDQARDANTENDSESITSRSTRTEVVGIWGSRSSSAADLLDLELEPEVKLLCVTVRKVRWIKNTSPNSFHDANNDYDTSNAHSVHNAFDDKGSMKVELNCSGIKAFTSGTKLCESASDRSIDTYDNQDANEENDDSIDYINFLLIRDLNRTESCSLRSSESGDMPANAKVAERAENVQWREAVEVSSAVNSNNVGCVGNTNNTSSARICDTGRVDEMVVLTVSILVYS